MIQFIRIISTWQFIDIFDGYAVASDDDGAGHGHLLQPEEAAATELVSFSPGLG